jgi:hypothetical protein
VLPGLVRPRDARRHSYDPSVVRTPKKMKISSELASNHYQFPSISAVERSRSLMNGDSDLCLPIQSRRKSNDSLNVF